MFEKMKMNKEKLLIMTTVMLGTIGIGIIIPVMPFYLKEMGSSDVMVTVFVSVFALCAFLSSPILGVLSDKFGRKPMLLVSEVSTFIGWVVFAFGGSLPVLLLGRIIDGVAAGNISIAQAYLADLAKDEKERASNMGLIGAAFGLGFVIGPALGSVLSTYSHQLPFIVVGALSLINTIGIALFVPESNKNKQKHLKTEINPLAPIYRAVTDRKLIARYSFWFIFGTVGSLYQAIFALFLIRAFGFTATITGIFFTAIGIMMVVNQGFVVRKFWLKKFSTDFLEKWPYFFGAISLVLIATQNLYLNILAMVFMVFTQSLIHITTSARFISLAGEHKKGEVLGVLSAIMSLSAVAGPIIGGIMFEKNISLPFLVGALLMLVVFIFIALIHKKEKKLKIAEEALAPETVV